MKITRTIIFFSITGCFLLFVSVFFIIDPQFALGEQPLREQKFDLVANDFSCVADVCTSFEVKPSFRFSYLAIEWPKESNASYRVFEEGSWSEWKALKGEADHRDTEEDQPLMMLAAVNQKIM